MKTEMAYLRRGAAVNVGETKGFRLIVLKFMMKERILKNALRIHKRFVVG